MYAKTLGNFPPVLLDDGQALVSLGFEYNLKFQIEVYRNERW